MIPSPWEEVAIELVKILKVAREMMQLELAERERLERERLARSRSK